MRLPKILHLVPAAALLALPAALPEWAPFRAPADARPPVVEITIDTDAEAVRGALQHYLQGHATGDPAHFRAVFHPEARLIWMRDGQVATRTSAEYIGGVSGRPAADEAQRRRWIESVDVTGDAAVAKIVLDYPSALITDYMSLLRIDGEWKIVNKSFTVQPKTR